MTGVAAAVTPHIASWLHPQQAAKGWKEGEKCVVRWGPLGQPPSALAGPARKLAQLLPGLSLGCE